MQHTDKARSEFEAAINAHQAENGFDLVTFFRAENGEYSDPTLNAGFWEWQASRAALVVELPDRMDSTGCTHVIESCRAAIEAAGVTVRG